MARPEEKAERYQKVRTITVQLLQHATVPTKLGLYLHFKKSLYYCFVEYTSLITGWSLVYFSDRE